MEAEITREDLKQELLANWDIDLLRRVGAGLGAPVGPDADKRQAVDTLVANAPLEKLLEQLLNYELTGELLPGSAPDAGGGTDGPPPPPSSVSPPPSSVTPAAADPAAVTVADAENVSQAFEAMSMVEDEIASQVSSAGRLDPGAADSASLVGRDTDATSEGFEVEEVPRDILEQELILNWGADEVRQLATHFGVAEAGRSKHEVITSLLDEVQGATLIRELAARDGAAREAAAASSAETVAEPAAAAAAAIAIAETQISEARETPGGGAADGPPPPPPRAAGREDYDASSLLQELRSMRRESEVDEDEEGDSGRGKGVLLAGGALLACGIFLNLPRGTPPPKPDPRVASTAPATPVASLGTEEGELPDLPRTVDGGAAPAEGGRISRAVADPAPSGASSSASDPVAPSAGDEPVATTRESTVPGTTTPGTPTPSSKAPGSKTPGSKTPGATTPGESSGAAAAPVSGDPGPAAPSGTSSADAPKPGAPPEPVAATAPPEPTEPAEPTATSVAADASRALGDGDLGRAIFHSIRALELGGEDFEAAPQLRRQVSDASFQLGETAFEAGQTEKAIIELSRAVEYRPGHGRAHFFLGRCQERQRDYEAAVTAYERAAELRPKDGRLFAYLAFAYRAARRYDDAEAAAARAEKLGEELDPGFRFLLRYRPVERAAR